MWTTTTHLTRTDSYKPPLNTSTFSLPSLCGGDPVEALAMMSAIAFTYGSASTWLMGLLSR
jgi:hypothetical protein